MNLSLTQTFYEGALSSPPMRQLPNQMLKELQQAKGASLESETLETIGRMAQFVSHDLRNRLSAIYASVEFMSESGRRHEEREELLKDVQVVIQEMTDMLDSLLLFSKAGRVRHPCWGSLNQVVEHAAYMVRPHPDARDVDLVVQNGAHVTCMMDSKKLESAIFNLLLNACQAAGRGLPPRSVKVSLTETHGSVHVRVVDSGPGVHASVRETLFQPFASTQTQGGTGLGLAIVARYVEEHGGYVDLEESSPGHTVFGLHLSTALQNLAPGS